MPLKSLPILVPLTIQSLKALCLHRYFPDRAPIDGNAKRHRDQNACAFLRAPTPSTLWGTYLEDRETATFMHLTKRSSPHARPISLFEWSFGPSRRPFDVLVRAQQGRIKRIAYRAYRRRERARPPLLRSHASSCDFHTSAGGISGHCQHCVDTCRLGSLQFKN